MIGKPIRCFVSKTCGGAVVTLNFTTEHFGRITKMLSGVFRERDKELEDFPYIMICGKPVRIVQGQAWRWAEIAGDQS